jgi:hypothetical protein
MAPPRVLAVAVQKLAKEPDLMDSLMPFRGFPVLADATIAIHAFQVMLQAMEYERRPNAGLAPTSQHNQPHNIIIEP